ncbi:MAG TPA: DUF3095 domain-containing protein [Candidatus Methylomirabilis sp.]|nr:DUF3095 domain-containing protein [Candidatus Methylomirabilis sp.]
MNTERFYAELPALDDFGEVFCAAHYRDFPDDWILYVCDVHNSTQAIQRGLYRAVNMVGASCITAALNACPVLPLPFVFGGDGATRAAPASRDDTVCRELASVAAMARGQFELELRIGRVPIATLRAAGHPVQVAKYRVAGDDVLAMLRGEGVAEAERWVKMPGSAYLIAATDSPSTSANLSGLSCRWEPLHSAHGEMVSLLIQARLPEIQIDAYYAELYRKIRDILALTDEELNPVKADGLRMKWPPTDLEIESRTHAGSGRAWSRVLAKLWTLLHSMGGRVIFATGIRTPLINPKGYMRSMIQRSDFRKFDGMLRMVLDVPAAKVPALLGLLEDEHRRGVLLYGVHRAPSAIMTCVVFSLVKDSHVHFIDGSDGGYALAAMQFKEQLKAMGR